jgi:hypothetical protein
LGHYSSNLLYLLHPILPCFPMYQSSPCSKRPKSFCRWSIHGLEPVRCIWIVSFSLKCHWIPLLKGLFWRLKALSMESRTRLASMECRSATWLVHFKPSMKLKFNFDDATFEFGFPPALYCSCRCRACFVLCLISWLRYIPAC